MSVYNGLITIYIMNINVYNYRYKYTLYLCNKVLMEYILYEYDVMCDVMPAFMEWHGCCMVIADDKMRSAREVRNTIIHCLK